MGTWAHETDESAPDSVTLLSHADGPIDLLDNGRGIRLTRDLARALAEHAAPERPGAPPHIPANQPARTTHRPPAHRNPPQQRRTRTLAPPRRGHDAAHLQPRLRGPPATTPPLIPTNHRRRKLDRLADNLDGAGPSRSAEETLTDPQQLNRHLSNSTRNSAETRTTSAGPTTHNQAPNPPTRHDTQSHQPANLNHPRGTSTPHGAGHGDRTNAAGPGIRAPPPRPGGIVARAGGPSRSGLRPALGALRGSLDCPPARAMLRPGRGGESWQGANEGRVEGLSRSILVARHESRWEPRAPREFRRREPANWR